MGWWDNPKFDLIGQRFGKLVVVSAVKIEGRRKWNCLCDCGKTTEAFSNNLKRGKHQSCGCVFEGKNRKRPFEWIYNNLKYSRHPVSLSYEEFVWFTEEAACHYCEEKLEWSPFSLYRGKRIRRTNLDRKDSDRGYSLDNCVACCPRCNMAKSDKFTYEEWLNIGRFINSMRKPLTYENSKKAMYERDGWKCRRCSSRQNLTPHHIVHRSRGGDDSLYNLLTLCLRCHTEHHNGKLVIERVSGNNVSFKKV